LAETENNYLRTLKDAREWGVLRAAWHADDGDGDYVTHMRREGFKISSYLAARLRSDLEKT